MQRHVDTAHCFINTVEFGGFLGQVLIAGILIQRGFQRLQLFVPMQQSSADQPLVREWQVV